MKFPKNMNRALLLNAAMITAVGGTSAAETSNQAATSRQKAISSRPNVIFFLVDDLGWSDIASFGSRFYETPNIDALGRDGVRFTNAYTTCHVSSPARASIMTGCYPATINMTDWLPGRREFPFQKLRNVEVNQDLPSDVPTIAETLRENGYHTAMIGKWHLGETGSTPEEHGFDMHIPHGYLKGWPARGYMAPFGMNGFDGEEGEYLTDRLTDEALRYIEQNQDEPFFLFMSHFAVHDPIQGRPDLVEKYRKKLLSMPKSDLPPFILEGNPDDENPASAEELLACLDNPTYAPHKTLPHRRVKIKQIQDNIQFAAMVESMDESMGRIVAKLKELGLYENTVIVFFADNGGMSAANYGGPNRVIREDLLDAAYSSSMLPLRGGKGWLYEGGLRVPMIVKAPGVKSGVCDQPVVSVDFYPTLLSLTGTPLPRDTKAEGVDISPLLQKKKMRDRPIFWHFPHYSNHGLQSPGGAVRYGDYKLIEYYENGTVQLFNLKKDIGEKNDLAARMPEKAEELKRMLHAWRESVGARMMPDNPNFDARVAAKREAEICPDRWWPMFTQYNGGLFGERVDLWRNNRLWYVAGEEFLLKGFESRPGKHPWQGEHVGKWLHAATLAYHHTGDERLKELLDSVVKRLIDTQLPDGYMGTYDKASSFVAKPEDGSKYMWDVWTHRYNLYGLLTYESFFPDERVLNACRRMADLLIDTFGAGRNDLTRNGTRAGMSSTTLLESVVMLYERTGEKKYLDFAEHIVAVSEANPDLHLLGELLSPDADVVKPGDGKVYQLLSNLLGYFRLYQVTGQERYLKAVQMAWNRVRGRHLLTTGGVWSRAADYNGNKECFAYETAFDPERIVVENCSNVTWIQLCLQLFDLTGMRKYMDEAEKCTLNDLFGHQHTNGVDGCYYTAPNQCRPPYVNKIHCCNSSAPRAMELMADHIAGEIDNCLSINMLTPSVVSVNSKFGGGELVVSGNYPFEEEIHVAVNIAKQPHIYKEYAIEFRVPLNTRLKYVEVNGEKVKPVANKRGYVAVKRIWNPGDRIRIGLDYQLHADIQRGEDGKRWIAFSYGPLALAQRISMKENPEPFVEMNLDTVDARKALLSEFMMDQSAKIPQFTVGDTGVVLMPYCCAGSSESGPRTYFALRPEAGEK